MKSKYSYENFTNVLFLDIETISSHENFKELSPKLQLHWEKKTKNIINNDNLDNDELYFQRAAIYSEFGKIITIAFGIIIIVDNEPQIRTSYFYSHNEYELLINFKNFLETKFSSNTILCAHNGKEFDFPYICRRMTILGIPIPEILNISGKKPWEIRHLDTMEMWKFGDRKSYTSLDLLTAILGIDSSKTTMDGSLVNSKYYKENALEEISKYCVDDVIATIQVFLKINFLKPIKKENINFTILEKSNIDTYTVT